MQKTKYCPGCQTEKPLTEWGKNRARRDGLTSYCRICKNARRNARYARQRLDPEWVEMRREQERSQYARNPMPERRKTKRDWARTASDPVLLAESNRQHRDYVRERYHADPEFKAHNRAYYARRRAMVRANGRYEIDDWAKLTELSENKCLSCGAEELLEVDHVIPVSQGGSSNVTNIQPLCRSCNASKGVAVMDYRTPAIKRWLARRES